MQSVAKRYKSVKTICAISLILTKCILFFYFSASYFNYYTIFILLLAHFK